MIGKTVIKLTAAGIVVIAGIYGFNKGLALMSSASDLGVVVGFCVACLTPAAAAAVIRRILTKRTTSESKTVVGAGSVTAGHD